MQIHCSWVILRNCLKFCWSYDLLKYNQVRKKEKKVKKQKKTCRTCLVLCFSSVDRSADCSLIKFHLADEIDLLNVSFDGQFAPDRISAKAGIKELRSIAPLRRYTVQLLGLLLCQCPCCTPKCRSMYLILKNFILSRISIIIYKTIFF